MANLSDQKTLQNKSAVMGPTTVHLDTISDLDPAVFEGTFAYSSDKKMYFSNGSTWRTTEDPVIKTPSASSPTADTTTQRQLTLSQYTNSLSSAPYKQIGIVIEVSLSSNMRNLILQKTIDTTVKNSAGIITDWPKTNKYNLLATDTLPNLKPGDVFYWRGKYLATEGQESGFSKPFAQTFPDYIDAPKPISGMNETTNIISVSAYHSPFDIENLYPPYQIQWMLSRNADFSGSFTIKTDIASSNPLDTITLFSTADNTYYWKARYFSTPASGNKNSEYSIPAQSKQVRDISTPKVVPVLGASGKVAQLKITPYNSLTNKSLLETEWLIATSSTNLDKDTGTRYTTTNDTLDIVSLPKISVLDNSQTIYYWKARYKNTITSSEWSPGSTFIRYPEIVAPTVITALGAETKTFVISPFSSEYSTIYPYELTEWLVYDVYDKLVYSETSPSNNSLDIFIHKNVILPDGKYTWSVRYKNTRGTYTTSISSTNYQIPLINKPIPVTVANGTLNQDTLVASPFTSEFGLSPSKSEITILDLNNKTVEVIPFIPDSVETLNVFNRLRGYSILLEAGKNYYWKVKYIGVDSLDVIHESKYSELSTFTQPLYIKTPYITLPAATDPTNQYEGPTITFTSSDFSVEQTFNNKKDNHRYSDWQLASTLDAFVQADRGNYEFITDKVVKSSTVLTTWTTKVLNTGTTYYVRVRHYGDYGYSNWSTPVRFSTLYQYKHFVTLPANYNPNPTIGQGYLGGFYAGNMWQNLTSSNTRIYLNTISVGQTVDFDVPSMQSINNRIVYLGQVLQIRATNYPTDIVITGTVTVASGTVLKISVTNIKKPSTYSVNGSTNYWSVMAKFQIIVSPKSSGYIPDTDRIILRDNNVVDYEYLKPKTTSNAFNQNYAWRNFELSNVDRTVLSEPNDQYLYDVTNTSELLDWPQEFFNLSDGQAIQTAMWRFSWLYYAWISYAANKAYPNSQFTVDSILKPNRPELVFPLAHYVYNLNKNTGINSYRDWYVPSRDELQLCFTNLISTEYSATPAYSTKFAAYRYNPANYSNPSGTSSNFRIDSYISINGNISDAYVTPLDLGLTAPDKVNTHGNNNNSEPYQKPYFYYVSTTLNGRKVDPYLAETTEIGDQYYFPKSNNIYFAQNGTETLTNGTSNRSNAHLLSATCLKTNETSANEYNDSSYNRATLTSNSYIHPVYRIYVNQDIYSYGLFSITYSYNNNISTRLIRRQLA
jgi:hypothetical protein